MVGKLSQKKTMSMRFKFKERWNGTQSRLLEHTKKLKFVTSIRALEVTNGFGKGRNPRLRELAIRNKKAIIKDLVVAKLPGNIIIVDQKNRKLSKAYRLNTFSGSKRFYTVMRPLKMGAGVTGIKLRVKLWEN